MKKTILIIAVIICISTIATIFAQTDENGKNGESPPDDLLHPPTTPIGCELARRIVADALVRAKKSSEAKLIVIIKQGKNERKKISKLRVEGVKRYFRFRDFSNYETAIGDKLDGFGRIEIYVQGQLLYSLSVAKNKVFEFPHCSGG